MKVKSKINKMQISKKKDKVALKLPAQDNSRKRKNGKKSHHAAEKIVQNYDESSEDDEGIEAEASDEEYVKNDGNSYDRKSGSDDAGPDSEEEFDEEGHKQSLEKLKETDPDFYKFLQENDKNLLDFEASDESGDEDDDADREELHKPDEDTLEAASDESDFEADETVSKSSKKLTLKMIKKWQGELQSDGKISIETIDSAIKAFNAAMLTVSSNVEKTPAAFKVEGSAVFNAVVQMCVMYLQPALKKYLGIDNNNKDVQKCKHWVKLRNRLKFYLNDLLKLLGGVTSANILVVLLKHLHQMTSFVACYPRMIKPLFKRLLVLWSSSEETVRVLAFMCLLRITRNQQQQLLDSILKLMYMTYVKNCKFVSPGSWPGINFMRRSLVEMFALDLNVAYQHVFLYIRQLAIHLRTATVVHKKENIQAVYNWQYVNSLHLWADLLGATRNRPQLEPLLFPLSMIAIHTIKLVPTAQYYPLRFHIVRILSNLSKESNTFIPVLPFIIEILATHNFNKKHKKVSMKPLDFSCILRLSKSQLSENGFKDVVIDSVYELLLLATSSESHSIGFPDLMLPCILQLKQFLKTCSVGNYCKKIRQILEKIEESVRFIEAARKKITFSLTDVKLINSWETTVQNKGTPLSIFYDSWHKLNKVQKKKKAISSDELVTELPKIKKLKKVPGEKQEGPVELFPSDSEDERVGAMAETAPKQKKKRGKKKKSKPISDSNRMDLDDSKTDIVKDFNMKDW